MVVVITLVELHVPAVRAVAVMYASFVGQGGSTHEEHAAKDGRQDHRGAIQIEALHDGYLQW
jgi:hypothetical protein